MKVIEVTGIYVRGRRINYESKGFININNSDAIQFTINDYEEEKEDFKTKFDVCCYTYKDCKRSNALIIGTTNSKEEAEKAIEQIIERLNFTIIGMKNYEVRFKRSDASFA